VVVLPTRAGRSHIFLESDLVMQQFLGNVEPCSRSVGVALNSVSDAWRASCEACQERASEREREREKEGGREGGREGERKRERERERDVQAQSVRPRQSLQCMDTEALRHRCPQTQMPSDTDALSHSGLLGMPLNHSAHREQQHARRGAKVEGKIAEVETWPCRRAWAAARARPGWQQCLCSSPRT